MTTRIKPADLNSLRNHSLGCWWPVREKPVWSGIANDLGKLALLCDSQGDTDRAREFARLRTIAETAQRAQYA